jgi:hypothetical protein
LSVDEGLHVEAIAYGGLGLVHLVFIPRKKTQANRGPANKPQGCKKGVG